MINFIDTHIMQQPGWAEPKIKTTFRLSSKTGAGPVVTKFNTVDDVDLVLNHCRNLSSYNSQRRSAGGRSVSVQKHYDLKTNGEIQWLNNRARAIRLMPEGKDLNVTVNEQIDPTIAMQGRTYGVHGVPAQYAKLIAKFNGF